MRCPKCNDPDLGKIAVIQSKEGWYKGTIPAQLEILICEKCGHKESVIEIGDGQHIPFGDIWVAQWHPQPGAQSDFFKEGDFTAGPKTEAYWGGYGPRIYTNKVKFDFDDFEGRMKPDEEKFEFKPHFVRGHSSTWCNVDEAREFFMNTKVSPDLQKLKDDLDHIMNPFKRPIYQPEEPGDKAKRKLDAIIKVAKEEEAKKKDGT